MKTNFSNYEIGEMNKDLALYSNQQVYQALYNHRIQTLQNSSFDNDFCISYTEIKKELETTAPDWTQDYLNSFY